MNKLKTGGYDQNQVQFVELFGNPKKQLEPYEFRIYFPFGSVSVCRTTDNNYWVHFATKRTDKEGLEFVAGKISNARLDIDGQSVHEARTGDLKNPKLRHLALLIKGV